MLRRYPPHPPRRRQYKKIRFGVFTPGEQKHSLNTRSLVSDVRLAQLMVSDSQRALIESIYTIDASNPTPPIIDSVFSTDIEGQLQASAVMAQHASDVGACDDLSNRWTSQWSEQTGKEGAKIKRVLYLCSCGYEHTKRNTKYDRQQPQDHLGSRERHNPLPFTGCLAHAEVTLRGNSIVRPSAPSQASAGSSSLKRTAQLLAPSPEKAQKRHESYAPH
ncbi:hypothetical protein C8J57DRAFT_1492876 [Mycena rebaudengoi]|nr:hypothetical protein C8J57DRAFT_1492876 [Mycena rebaudengoi]